MAKNVCISRSLISLPWSCESSAGQLLSIKPIRTLLGVVLPFWQSARQTLSREVVTEPTHVLVVALEKNGGELFWGVNTVFGAKLFNSGNSRNVKASLLFNK